MRRLVVLAVPALLLLVGCGDGGDDEVAGGGTTTTTATSTTVTVDGATDVCADLETSVLEPVEDPGPPDDRPEDAPPDPAEVEAFEAAGAALSRLAETGPEELRADAAAMAEVLAVGWEQITSEQSATLAEPGERLIAFGAEECPLDAPVWACFARGTFRSVGAPIGGPSGPPASPEEVVTTIDVDPTWERVEVERTDGRVTFAWLGADGLALASATAEATDDGSWRQDQSTRCDALQPLPEPTGDEGGPPAPIDPPVDQDDLPPPSATSLP